jgi:hypothetical protein
MNARQLSKNVGNLFRLRPLPFRKDPTGKTLPQTDDQWRLDRVDFDPARIRLTNIRTGHQLELEADNIMERRSPDFLLLRCEVTITPDGLNIEPINRGTPIVPPQTAAQESRPKGEPKYINLPAGYEGRLNYHRFRIAKDAAAKDERGGYRFPVRVKGAEADVRAFQRDVQSQFGVFPTVTSFAGGVGEIEFTYLGESGPEALENVAIKHRLTVLQCGNPFTR